MVKMNFTNNQKAFEYAMYMMLGSYFNKAFCKNTLLEKKMYVQYLEQKEKKQIELEDVCLRFIEKELIPQLPKELWEHEVEVRFRPTKLQGLQAVQFQCPDYILRVSGIYQGKYNTNIHYEIWKRGKDYEKNDIRIRK